MLASFDEQIDAISQPKTTPAKWLSNGFYTLTFPDGSHRTFRIRTEKNGIFKGHRTLSILTGPQNTNEYEPFATTEEDGFRVWKRHATGKNAAYAFMLWEMAKGVQLIGHELLISKRCLVCNRPLTTPESIALGIGPGCQGKIQ